MGKLQSWENARETWLPELRQHAEPESRGLSVTLVGNKTDLHHLRQVDKSEVEEYAEREGHKYVETSALDGLNVDQAFRDTLTAIYTRVRSASPPCGGGGRSNSGVELDSPQRNGSSAGGGSGGGGRFLSRSSCCS